MPYVNPEIFGNHPRFDGKPGRQHITATMQRYVEEDGTDCRVYRVRVYDASGNLERTYLMDLMGVPFADEPYLLDDPAYVESLRQKIR